jgi:NADH:ubiquinone oxidoreductase subunit E
MSRSLGDATGNRTAVRGNPGFAGETGDFQLSEADVRGSAFVANRPVEGGDNGGVNAYPYQLLQKNPDAELFAGPYRARMDRIKARYPDKLGALLPALNLAQEIRGWLSPESMAAVAQELELSPTYVRGVATFYTMYNKQPVGDFFVQVCTNVACNLCGADDVMAAFLAAAGTDAGELSSDGAFTVIEAECLGACGFPTAVQINERYYENVEVGDVPAIIERLRRERTDAGARGGAQARGLSGAQPADAATGRSGKMEVPQDPAAASKMAPESNPTPGADSTPPAASRPPASDRPATEGQG